MKPTTSKTHTGVAGIVHSSAASMVAFFISLGLVLSQGIRVHRFTDAFTYFMVVVAGAAAFAVALDWALVASMLFRRQPGPGVDDGLGNVLTVALPGMRFRTRVAPLAQGLGFAGTLLGICIKDTALDVGRLPLAVACRTSLIGIVVALSVTCANYVIEDWSGCAKAADRPWDRRHSWGIYLVSGAIATCATFLVTYSLDLGLRTHDKLMAADPAPSPIVIADEKGPDEPRPKDKPPRARGVTLRQVLEGDGVTYALRDEEWLPEFSPGVVSPVTADGEQTTTMSSDNRPGRRIYATTLVDVVNEADRIAFDEWAQTGHVLFAMGLAGSKQCLVAWTDSAGKVRTGSARECLAYHESHGREVRLVPIPVSLLPVEVPITLSPVLNQACDAAGIVPMSRVYFLSARPEKRAAMLRFAGSFPEPRDGSELIAVRWCRSPPGFEVTGVSIIQESEYRAQSGFGLKASTPAIHHGERK